MVAECSILIRKGGLGYPARADKKGARVLDCNVSFTFSFALIRQHVRFLSHHLTKALQELFNSPLAMPTHHGRGDLIADGVAQNCGVSCALPQGLSNSIEDVFGSSSLIQEGDVLLPR